MSLVHPARAELNEEQRAAATAELLRLLEAEQRHQRTHFIDTIFPDTGPLRRELYPKHMEFLAAGAFKTERAMMAGNRCGKSLTAAYEVVCHATGRYPKWWRGRRFAEPVTIWACGNAIRDVRDSAQPLLLGKLGELGTQLLPLETIVRTTARPGTPDAVDSIHVKHASGLGNSVITFKTYEAGREAFQAATCHVVWLDEEPPLAVYDEAMMRTATVKGIVLCTFTPMLGLSDVALRFWNARESTDKHDPYTVMVEWADIPHLDEDEKAKRLAAIPPHLRDARTKGIPHLGSGAIYAVDWNDVVIDAFPLPRWGLHVYGMDVGWNRTAVLWGVLDQANDTLFIRDEYYVGQAESAIHVAAIKARGEWIPGVVDPASRGRSQQDGEQLFNVYRRQGLMLTPAVNSVEAGIYEVWQRLSTGRLKIFKNCRNLLDELRIYRRNEKGVVVKEKDHACDALRYMVMSGVALAARVPGNRELPIELRPQEHERADFDWSWVQAARKQSEANGMDYRPLAKAWGGDSGGGGGSSKKSWKGLGRFER